MDSRFKIKRKTKLRERQKSKCSCFVIKMLFICLIVLFCIEGHHILCTINLQLCTNPLSQIRYIVMVRNDGRPAPFAEETHPSLKDSLRPACAESELTLNMTLAHSRAQKEMHISKRVIPKPMIMLASQKSGSTWVQQKLNQNADIILGSERMLDMARECNIRRCTWDDWKNEIEKHLMSLPAEYPFRPAKYIGVRIMYDHIPTEFRQQFADWASCNGVAVIHFIRESVIESFWTLQARTLDTLSLRRYVDDSVDTGTSKILASNKIGIALDPEETNKYVRNIEQNRRGFRKLLHHYPGKSIKYWEVSYEDLTDPNFASTYWKMASSFFESSKVISIGSRNYQVKKLHPGNCQSKILNWKEIEEKLKGTEALDACLSRKYLR